MKKIFLILTLILIFTITYIPQKTRPVFNTDNNSIEEFSNDDQCLDAVKRIGAAFPMINTVSVLCKKNSCLCGITTDEDTVISETSVKKFLYETFPNIKNLKLEINTKRAEDIMELSYFASNSFNKKYISLRYDFLISED